MPKTTRKKKKKQSARHDPLEKQIMASLEKGTLREPRHWKEAAVQAREAQADVEDEFVTDRMRYQGF